MKSLLTNTKKYFFYKNIRVAKNILKVDVGSGYFFEKVKPHGHQVSGTELNPSAAELARALYSRVFELVTLYARLVALFDMVCA